MITLLFAAGLLAALWWLIEHRTAAALAGFFVLFSLLTRVIGLSYVDLAGPVYAVELQDFVGGGGSSMPLFALSVLAFMLPLGFVFRPGALKRLAFQAPLPIPRSRLAATVAAGLAMFVFALYADLVTRGPIPLFSGIDRLEYNRNLAGPIHPLAFDFGFLFATMIGIGFVYPRLRGREFDFRYLLLYVAFMLYFGLTGNRFSAFYSFSSFLIIPLAALLGAKVAGRLPAPPPGRSPLVRLMCSPAAMVLALAAAAVAIAVLLVHNLVTVREYDDPAEQFTQRTLVQPVQLWWTTWKSLDATSDSQQSWKDAFVNPIDPTRNTSIQVLMIKNLGDDRAAELIENGQQYAGGYPEILFELFGPWSALILALVFGSVTALLLRVVVMGVMLGRLLTAMLGVYVFFGFSLLYIGGMLNFLLVWTFWAKCTALAFAYLIERRSHRTTQRSRRRTRSIAGAAA